MQGKETKKPYWYIIVAPVLNDVKLSPSEKILYSVISGLTNEKGFCYCSNKYLAEWFKKTEETISRWINNLKKQGHVKIKYEYKGTIVTGRKIFLSHKNTIDENINGYQKDQQTVDKLIISTVDKNLKVNDISINDVSINDIGGKNYQAIKKVRELVYPDLMLRWMKYRKECGKPLAPSTLKRTNKEFKEMGFLEASKRIERAISNGWNGWNFERVNNNQETKNINDDWSS